MIRKLAMALLAVFLLAGCAKEKFELTKEENGMVTAKIENGQKESTRSVGAVEIDEVRSRRFATGVGRRNINS